MSLWIRLLGGFSVTIDGRVLSARRPTRRLTSV
jgi:hypothetical protein